MDHRVREAIEEKVAGLRRNAVSDTSRRIYERSNLKFVVWLHENHPELIVDGFGENDEGVFVVDVAKQQLHCADTGNPPIVLESLEAIHFLSWIVSLKRSDENDGDGVLNSENTPLSHSTYNSHRAALTHLFREYNVTMPRLLSDELTTHYKGLKRQLALDAARGQASVRVGKEAMEYALYQWICAFFLRSGKKHLVFAHRFLVLCWNLMCRAGNAVPLVYVSLTWNGKMML